MILKTATNYFFPNNFGYVTAYVSMHIQHTNKKVKMEFFLQTYV